MELFGIGPMELVFIFIIILLVLGPNDIQKAARNFGKLLNRLYRSPGYNMVRQASDELRNLPARLAREAQLDELKNLDDLKDIKNELQQASNAIRPVDQPKTFDAWVNDLTQPAQTPPPPRNGTPPAPSNGQVDKQERDA
jgi:Sec-independent protein translocase protein TatA